MFEQIEWISGVALIGLGVLLLYASNLIRGQRDKLDNYAETIASLLEDADDDRGVIADLRDQITDWEEGGEIELDIDLDGEDDDDDLD